MDPLYLQVFFGGLTTGSIYAMIAVGFTLVYRSTRVINFAHGEFVMLGAMFAISGLRVLHLPLVGALALGVVGAAIAGAVFQRAVLAPGRQRSPSALILITVACSLFLQGTALVVWGKDALPFPPLSGGGSIFVAGAAVQPQVLWILALTGACVAALSWFLNRTLYGKALRACAENSAAAQLVGIDVGRIVLMSVVISAAIGGLAGVLITPITSMDFQSGFLLAMKGLTGAIVGGLERVTGVVVGGLLLGLVEAFGAAFISSLMKDALTFVVLIAVLIVWPNGLFGRRTAR